MSDQETPTAVTAVASETAGARAEETGLPIPADLAARFADMIGEWAVTGTETVVGQTNDVKGRVVFSPVVGGMALLASGKFQSPPRAWSLCPP